MISHSSKHFFCSPHLDHIKWKYIFELLHHIYTSKNASSLYFEYFYFFMFVFLNHRLNFLDLIMFSTLDSFVLQIIFLQFFLLVLGEFSLHFLLFVQLSSALTHFKYNKTFNFLKKFRDFFRVSHRQFQKGVVPCLPFQRINWIHRMNTLLLLI